MAARHAARPAGWRRLSDDANTGKEADRLVAVSTTAAGKSEIHEMSMNDGVMKMRPVEGGIEIPAGQTVELKQGGLHLMFMQVAKPFAEGDTVTVTLEFEKAGKIEIVLPVKTAADGQAEHKH
jgi:copper(I)-binding protein